MTSRFTLSAVLATLAVATSCFASSAWVSLHDGTTPGSLARFDLSKGKALPPLSSAFTAPQDAVYSPNGATIYVAYQNASDGAINPGQVAFLDSESGSVKTTVSIQGVPFSLAISPDGSRLYVAYSSIPVSSHVPDVAAINTANGEIIEVGSSGTGSSGGKGRLTLSRDGTALYVTSGNLVVSFDAATLAVTHTLDIYAAEGVGSAVSPDGTLLFVPTSSNGNAVVTAVQTSTFTVAWSLTIATAASPGPLTLDAQGRNLYAADTDGLVAAIALPSQSIRQTFQLPHSVSDLAMAPSEQSLVALLTNGVVSSLNLLTGKTMTLFTVPGPVAYESLNPHHPILLIADQSNLFQKVDLQTGQSSVGVPIGNPELQGVAEVPSGRLAFTAGQNGITVVNLSSGAYVSTISTPPISSVVAAPNGQAVHATSGSGLLATVQLWVINPLTLQASPAISLPANINDWCAISADSSTLFFATANGLVEVDTSTFNFTVLPGDYGAVATSPGQPSYVYVFSSVNGDTGYKVIDYSTGTVIDDISLGSGVGRSQLVVSSNGRYGYDLAQPEFIVCYDFATGQLQFVTDVEALEAFALTPDQQTLSVSTASGQSLRLFNALTGDLESTIALIGNGGPLIAVQ